MAEHGLDEADVEIETQRPTDTLGTDKDGRGSLATARERKTLVIDAELTGLRIGQAYLRLSGYPPALVAIGPPENLPAIAPDHIPVTPAIGEPRGLTRAEARLAASYQPGDIVAFRKSEERRPRAGIGYRVEAVDAERGTVRLVPEHGKAHDWQPARWGSAQAEAFVEVEQEFRAGDKVQFTRNNYRAERLNGQTAEVVAIDPVGSSMVVERDNGRRDMLDLAHLADRHVRPGWVRTIHSSQGIGSWPIWRASAPTSSTPHPSMSRSAGPEPARPSIPTAAPASPLQLGCVVGRKSGRSLSLPLCAATKALASRKV